MPHKPREQSAHNGAVQVVQALIDCFLERTGPSSFNFYLGLHRMEEYGKRGFAKQTRCV